MARTSSLFNPSRLLPLLALTAFAAEPAAAARVDLANATLVGLATVVGKSVRLDPKTGGEPGAVWQNEPISLLDSFEIDFTFSLAAGTSPQADGIALVIQTDGPTVVGEGGGGVGYQGLHGVASVVQTYVNNHLGLDLDSNPYNAKPAPADLGAAQLVQGRETVSYDAVNHVLAMRGRITVDGVAYDVHDSKAVDLASLLGSDTATIGLTGGTGANTAAQRVGGWQVTTTP